MSSHPLNPEPEPDPEASPPSFKRVLTDEEVRLLGYDSEEELEADMAEAARRGREEWEAEQAIAKWISDAILAIPAKRVADMLGALASPPGQQGSDGTDPTTANSGEGAPDAPT